MTREDRNVLKETYQAAKTSADTIRGLVGKTEDEDLADDLNRQLGKYQKFAVQAQRYLHKEGERLDEETNYEKAKFWLGIQAGTMLNNSTPHIANMVIRENTRGMGEMMKTLRDNKMAKNNYCEFANELMDFTESSINQLKYYLKVL